MRNLKKDSAISLLLILSLLLVGVPGSVSPPARALIANGIVASNYSVTTSENVPVKINVLQNDYCLLNGLPCPDGMYVQSVTRPSAGVAVINPDNTVSYTPNNGFVGSDSFTYTAADNLNLFTGTGTVSVAVTAVSTTTTASSTSTSASTTTVSSTTTISSTTTVSTSTTTVSTSTSSSSISTSTSTSTTSTTTSVSSTTTVSSTSSGGGTSQLTVNTQLNGGGTITGLYTILYQGKSVVATGFSPAQFTVNNGQTYGVQVSDYNQYYFQYWQDTGSVNLNDTVTLTSSAAITAIICNGPPGTCPDPTPVNGITFYAHRVQASYWDPCFATACSAGTGPGATMYFILCADATCVNVVQSGFANERGFTFTGLSPSTTYYLYPEDCDACHGSSHDVVFQQWGDGSTVRPLAVTAGASLDAWFSCTNGCA